jgi:hypothetical protein
LILYVKHAAFAKVAFLDFDDKLAPDENSKPDPLSDLTLELIDAIIVFLELAS